MSVLSRDSLEASPLADLHQIAADLGLDGYRRLRKADLIDRLIEAQGGAPSDSGDGGEQVPRRERPSRAPRSRSAGARGDGEERRGEQRRREERQRAATAPEAVEGRLEVHASGSGFVHPAGGGPEIYVSAAQIRRLELSDGDKVGGPVRPPRRSERHPSLVRVETINGKNADEVAPVPPEKPKGGDRGRRQEVTLPCERFPIAGDQTLAEIDRVAPIGRGSRVVLHGGPHSGKTTAARALAAALKALDGVEVFSVLCGVRPEEEADWAAVEPASIDNLESSPDSRARSLERAVDKAKRSASKGKDAVVIVDSVDDLPGAAVRKSLAVAGIKAKGGSITVAVVASAPVGGETTVVGFDQSKAAAGKFPSIDVNSSSSLKPELLLDDRSLKAYRKAHADAGKKRRWA